MKHVMLDLETMGVSPGCAVISIGAVLFDPQMGDLGDTFYIPIRADQAAWGLAHDPQTVAWWGKQSEEARKVFTDDRQSLLPAALRAFGDWLPQDVKVWGNGASFDNAILAAAARAAGVGELCNYYNDRCYRTVKAMAPHIKLTRVGTFHNAVDDAISQANHLMAIRSGTAISLF